VNKIGFVRLTTSSQGALYIAINDIRYFEKYVSANLDPDKTTNSRVGHGHHESYVIEPPDEIMVMINKAQNALKKGE